MLNIFGRAALVPALVPALAAALLALASPAFGEAPKPRLALEGAAGDLAIGTTSDIRVMVHDAPPVAGMQLAIRYDPAFVKVVDTDAKTAGAQAAHGTFFNAQKDFFTVRNDADAKTGQFDYVVSALYPAKESQGDGQLLTLRITPFRPGDSEIRIVSAKFGDFAGKPYEVTPGEPLALHAIAGSGGFLAEAKALQPAPVPVQPAMPQWLSIVAAFATMVLVGGAAFWFGRRVRRGAA